MTASGPRPLTSKSPASPLSAGTAEQTVPGDGARVSPQDADLAAAIAHAERLQTTLDARDAAHAEALRVALLDQEASHRADLGPLLSAAVTIRARVRDASRRLTQCIPRLLGHLAPMSRVDQSVTCRRLFDAEWYVRQVPAARRDPLRHFLDVGWRGGYDPHPLFDTSWYLEQNPDVAAAGVNPLQHFLTHGGREGRDPHPLFDTTWYLKRYPDLASAPINPLVHYLAHGAAEGRDPNPLFDTDWYAARNPDATAGGMNPLVHYVTVGAARRRDPHELFDTNWYLANHPDAAAGDSNPLVHHLLARKEAEQRPDDPDAIYTKRVLFEQQRLALELPELLRHIDVMLFRPTFVIHIDGSDDAGRSRSLASLRRQIYPDWTASDQADRAGLAEMLASRPESFLIWLTAGDALNERALYAFASALNADPTADLVYANDDTIDPVGARFRPFYKPAWSPVTLESFNYIGPTACYRGQIASLPLRQASGVYDFVLRFTEQTSRVRHVPDMLCHRVNGATSAPSAAQIAADTAALQGRLRRTGRAGSVTPIAADAACYDTTVAPASTPAVSVVIVDHGGLIDCSDGGRLHVYAPRCVEAIQRTSTHRQIELIVVDTGGLAAGDTEQLRQRGCKLVRYTEANPNVARQYNLGASIATGELLVLLSDDVEPLTADWIERLLSPLAVPHVGVAGAKIVGADGALRHVGLATIRGAARTIRRGFPRDDRGYFFSSRATRDVAAVGNGCLATHARTFRQLGGFTETLTGGHHDVDFCLKARESGLTVVVVPTAELAQLSPDRHLNGASLVDEAYLESRWAQAMSLDPYYNEAALSTEPPTFDVAYGRRWL